MHGNINPIILVYFKFEACASIKVYLNIILYYICPPQLEIIDITVIRDCNPGGGGGTLGISGWGCAAGTLEPLTYTRASSAEFCYPILE